MNHGHFEKYPWLVYSHKQNGLFCKYCVLFVVGETGCSGKHKNNEMLKGFVTQLVIKYDKLYGKDGRLVTHELSLYHNKSSEYARNFITTYKDPDERIVNRIDAQKNAAIIENRERIKPIIESVIFLGRQNIPFRGHRDDGRILDVGDNPSKNDGNFRQLLRFRVNSGDEILRQHLKLASARATYISKSTQNEIISTCGEFVLKEIIKKVDLGGFYSIMFDETTDLAHISQMSIVIRYVDGNCIREDFVQFLDCYNEGFDVQDEEPSLTGKKIGELVLNKMKSMEQNVNQCVGVCTDGCAVMTSKLRGSVSTVLQCATNAVRCHCFNHALNLSLSKCCAHLH